MARSASDPQSLDRSQINFASTLSEETLGVWEVYVGVGTYVGMGIALLKVTLSHATNAPPDNPGFRWILSRCGEAPIAKLTIACHIDDNYNMIQL